VKIFLEPHFPFASQRVANSAFGSVTIKGPLNDLSIKAIPARPVAVTVDKYSSLLFAPYVFTGIVTGEFAAGALKAGNGDSAACLKYAKTRKETHKKKCELPVDGFTEVSPRERHDYQ
jgi:hypothetical protein